MSHGRSADCAPARALLLLVSLTPRFYRIRRERRWSCPEHAIDALTGPSDDGLGLFLSALDAVVTA